METLKAPVISVIMSVYNDEIFLKRSIESVLMQDFSDFEFLITDDCSTDDSLSIIKGFADKDKRIRIFENSSNKGLTKNLNMMISEARGKYIARMDGDDISFPDRFQKQMEIFNIKPSVDVVFTGTIIIDVNGENICHSWRPDKVDKILEFEKGKNYIPHPTVIIKKCVFDSCGLYNEDCVRGQDQELWQRFKVKGVCFEYIPKPLLYFRFNPNGLTYSRNKDNRGYVFRLISKCIDSFSKRKALNIMMSRRKELKFYQMCILFLKIIIPVRLRMFKSRIINRNKNKLIDGNYN